MLDRNNYENTYKYVENVQEYVNSEGDHHRDIGNKLVDQNF